MLTHLPQGTPHQNDFKGNCKSQKPNFALIQDKENRQVKPLGAEKVKYISVYPLPFLVCWVLLVSIKEQSDTNYNARFSPKWQYKFCNLLKSKCHSHISCTHCCGSTDNCRLTRPERNTSNSSKKEIKKISKAYEKLKRNLLKLGSLFSVYLA